MNFNQVDALVKIFYLCDSFLLRNLFFGRHIIKMYKIKKYTSNLATYNFQNFWSGEFLYV